MGSSLSDFQRDLLIEIGEPVVLCYDNDHAGDEGLFGPWDRHVGAHKGGGAVDTLKKELPTKLALYPQGVDDPDDLTLQQLQRMLSVDHELCS
jgi:DNA primase